MKEIKDVKKSEVIHIGTLTKEQLEKFIPKIDHLKARSETFARSLVMDAKNSYGKQACVNVNGNKFLTYADVEFYVHKGNKVLNGIDFI